MVDQGRLDEVLGKIMTDIGAAFTQRLVYVGDKLGLYKAMAGAGPLTPAELAARTDTAERYVREWLGNQVAAGYIAHEDGRFTLSDEAALVLADETSPAFVAGLSQALASTYRDEAELTARFKTGEGLGWHEHDADLYDATERLFRPGYLANLVESWLPALEGVVPKLEAGARVADVGCGHGVSTIVMAKAFPQSTFVGYDYHQESIDRARKLAAEAGVGDRVTFEVGTAATYPGTGYDLVAFFDCLHDMGDPVGASRHVLSTLAPDGSWLIVEPFANDSLDENTGPVAQVFYGASTLICTPASLSQEVGLALGAQAGEAALRAVVTQGGFTRFRRATETPFNLVLEARP